MAALYLLVAGDPGPPHLLPLLALLAAAGHAEPHVPALAHEHPAGRSGQLDIRYWLDLDTGFIVHLNCPGWLYFIMTLFPGSITIF